MKAVHFKKYGAPKEVLKIEELAQPRPKENEVLVKIHTSAINDYDWSMVRGKPYLYRIMFGLLKPKHPIPGMELAGVVEAIGAKVESLKVGDAVFGDTSDYGFGTLAEYLCIDEKAVIKKPAELTFEEATAIPHAFTLAWQALIDVGKLGEGQKVLINGGGGGVGTLGLQLAKHFHCEVTGVDTDEKLDMMTEMGFDFVLDYKKIDFTKNGKTYDVILDCKTNKSAFAYFGSLKPKGTYVSIGGKLSSLLSVFVTSKIASLFTAKKLQILSLKPNKDLNEIATFFRLNKFICKIDGPYRIEDVPKLIQYFGEGKHKGKVVIKMIESNPSIS